MIRGAATNRVGTVIAAARHTGRSIDVSGCAYGPATGDRFLDGPRS